METLRSNEDQFHFFLATIFITSTFITLLITMLLFKKWSWTKFDLDVFT